jgi:tetratricopeptide (TPR) repeat protein
MTNKPPSVDLVLAKARSLARTGAPDQARQLYRSVLSRFPGNKRALEGLRSLPQPTQSPKAGPTRDQINDLMALYNQNRLPEALTQASALAARFPDMPLILNILGAVHADLGQPEQAVASYTRALQIQPAYAEAHGNLANVLMTLGEHEKAIQSYNNALRAKPHHVDAHRNLANALASLGRHDEAAACFAEVLRARPDSADAHFRLGNSLNALGRHEQAMAGYAEALRISPDHAEAHNNLGNVLMYLGRHAQAIASYTRALECDPGLAEAQRSLGLLGKYRKDDPRIARMLQQIADPQTGARNRMHLGFALGKAYDDLGDVERAFRHLLEANRKMKRDLGYDIGTDRRLFGLIKSIFGAGNPPSLDRAQQSTGKGTQPIFIVGMPRSGTTLFSRRFTGKDISINSQ